MRWRGLALELIYSTFRKRLPAYDHVMLADVMRSVGGQDLGENDVIFVLRQLHDRGYLTYRETKNRWTNEVTIADIQITPKGCNIVEGVERDPAVRIL
jgi:uncharacterized protein YciU (UPF0263 family)